VEHINKSQLHVKVDAVCFGNFLNSEEQQLIQLQMVDGDEWTGLIEVHPVLENSLSMSDRPSGFHCTVQFSGIPLQCCMLAGGY
jgi:hypothetical protein